MRNLLIGASVTTVSILGLLAILAMAAPAVDDASVGKIIAWAGDTYDTCVQLIHIVDPVPVPLFSAPVVTILVLAMLLTAAVLMRRRAANKA